MKSTLLFLVFTLLSVVSAQSRAPTHDPDTHYHPQPYEIMYVGSQEYVSYDPSEFTGNDTVVFFFDEYRNVTLAYGPATKGNFSFTVPEGAFTPAGRNSTTLLGVFRRNFHLLKVEDIPVVVVYPPSNETTTTVQ